MHRDIVWITGASRGIGREVAIQFARRGCIVCLSGRSIAQLKELAGQIVSDGGHAFVFPMDMRKQEDIPRVVASINKTVGRVDVLVNNAGITAFKSIVKTSAKEFQEIISVNLISQILCTKAVLNDMVKRKSGLIFNILSRAAIKTFEDSGAYTASKAGMHGFGKVLRQELRSSGIRVTNVLPGPTETDMWSTGARKKFGHRMMKASSVAEAIVAVYMLPADVVVDDIMLRPMLGDID